MTPERIARLEQLGTRRGEGLAMIAVHVELCTAVRELMAEVVAARTDERAKVAEEVAVALLAVDPIEWALAGQSAGEDAAAIARRHA